MRDEVGECGGTEGALATEVALLLRDWKNLVAAVEEGYGWSAPELDHDAWCRRSLARLWPNLPEAVERSLQPVLDGLDVRFRAATVPWPDIHGAHEGEWGTRRIPRLLEPESGELYRNGWPDGWDMLPFPRPDSVSVI
ncbi:hypothetical protein OIE69_29785 [Actinacidiphila glaucinigra]|uniref:hypothetical protein n=1 Tax=Actinacidiphila glaucinigra TaxID=235986 RepID=UPI002DD84CD1|nr:hypothetical protein [Actinacidiphila glaucinigra]WSD62789.1 hypothetical protein OIE69_29785 [Actinacidiphila glaucinigra]